MASFGTALQHVQSEFLRQMADGRLERPVEQGSGLPNLCYTDADFFVLEQQTVFRNHWVFAAFAHDLASTGDMLPIEIAGQPLVLVRTEDGIRAFHNVCRHRGARLIESAGRHRKFVCPNHSWSYGLDGRLLMRPHYHGGERHDVNRAECHPADLRAVACETWHDWVFVNISGSAIPFTDAIAPITGRLEGYDLSVIGFADKLEFDIRANWKLAIENFIEPYHVFSCHPWLNGFVGMDERDAPTYDANVLLCGYEFRAPDPARGGQLPWFPNLPANKHNRGDWFVLFPNFAFEIFPDQVDVFVAWPEGTAQCRETIALYFVGDGVAGAEYADARQHVIDNWNELNHEDIGVIERMQAGRYSEGFDGGVLSPYWDPVQQYFAGLMTAAIDGPIFRN